MASVGKEEQRTRTVRRMVERVLDLGAQSRLPVDDAKRLRLCNINALGGSIIMGIWATAEARMHVMLSSGKPVLTLPLSVGVKF